MFDLGSAQFVQQLWPGRVSCRRLPPTAAAAADATAAAAAAVLPDAPFGLCLLFDSWRWGDESLGLPGWPRVLQGQVPDEGAVQQAADAVRQQADSVRALKTQQGLGNKVSLRGLAGFI